MAEALAYALTIGGILHLDVKPSNILAEADGTVVLADFGLARAADDSTAGEPFGTLAYMAPERILGKTQPNSGFDVYSLGVTLYELILLSSPFKSANPVWLMMEILSSPLPSLRKLRLSIPRDLDYIIQKAVADEGRRFKNAEEMAEELARFEEARPLRTRPLSWVDPDRLWRWCRLNRIAAVVIGALILAVGSVLAVLFANHQTTIQNLRCALVAEAKAWLSSDEPSSRFKGLDALRNAASYGATPELRDIAIAMLVRPDIHIEEDTAMPAGTLEVSVAPDLGSYRALRPVGHDLLLRAGQGEDLAHPYQSSPWELSYTQI